MKEAALEILKVAAKLFPPLGELLLEVLPKASAANRPLADEVREILPAEGASAAARRALEGPAP